MTQPPDLQRALLERLRFEQAMGVEFLARAQTSPPSPLSSEERGRGGEVSAAEPPLLEAPLIATQGGEGEGVADKPARWQALEARAMGCVKCVLHKGRAHVVFGCGNREARLLFVGEGPGADEDAQGIPFVGRAGQLLNKIITAMGMTREEVYICNVVKCRPPENRTPLPDEVAACSPYLFEQIELVAPKIIVTLGSPAAKTLLKITQGIMSIRGKWHTFRGIPVMPTYHPAYLLRAYTEENRRAVWEDMKKVVERLKR